MKLKGLFLILLLAGVGVSSCKKKCVIDRENSISGDIIPDATIYHVGYAGPNNGYHLTTDVNGIEIAGSNVGLEVSFDGGLTRGPINFTKYDVLLNPAILSCEAKVDKSVVYNAANQTVTYNVDVINCSSCDERYQAENYILVNKIPSNFTVLYSVSYTEVD
jgi:hypothetical protein